MIDWKRKKRWWKQETGQLNTPKKFFIQSYKHYNEKNLKQQPEEKNKNSRIYNAHHV